MSNEEVPDNPHPTSVPGKEAQIAVEGAVRKFILSKEGRELVASVVSEATKHNSILVSSAKTQRDHLQ